MVQVAFKITILYFDRKEEIFSVSYLTNLYEVELYLV